MNIFSLRPLSLSHRAWVFLLAGLLLLTGCSSGPSAAEKRLMAQRKFEEAQNSGPDLQVRIKKLKEAILLSRKEPMYRVALGNTYFRNSEYDKAERLYLSAIKVNREFVGAYRPLGRLYMQKGDWDKALYYLDRALRQPNLSDPIQLHNWKAYCYYRKRDLQKAEKAWLAALDIHESEEIRLNLALAYREANELQLARESLLKALELNPKLMGAHFALGDIYYRSNKLDQAKKHFTEVIHLEPLSDQAQASRKILKQLAKKK